jgi:alpha-tubulin suppressor-like RCC1 family protein
LPKVAQTTFKKATESHQQVFTTPQLIELEEEEAIENVYCGSKFTILKTQRNRLLACGHNNYGQLGLVSHEEDLDKFTEIPAKEICETTKIVCGHATTFLINL